MSNVLRRKAFLISSLALAIGAGNAVAGGFEKATMWDAKYSALGGAAASSVNNSSAMFFNPAGLAFVESNDISLHFSPTIVQANGPANGSDYTKGEKVFTPNGGFTGAYRLNDDFVLGYGVYGTGGAAAKYRDVTVGNLGGGFLPNTSVTGTYSTDIKIVEAAVGLGYRINNNWSVGGTYRFTYAYADINMLSSLAGVGADLGYNDMDGTNAFSVRLGAMYRSDDDRWGWGINYRSEVEVKADGKASFRHGAGENAPLVPPMYSGHDVTAKTALPMQISTGADYLLNNDWRLFGEATYTNYSTIEDIQFDSREGVLVDKLNTNWNDQWNFRIGTVNTTVWKAGLCVPVTFTQQPLFQKSMPLRPSQHQLVLIPLLWVQEPAFLQDKLLFDIAAEYNHISQSLTPKAVVV